MTKSEKKKRLLSLSLAILCLALTTGPYWFDSSMPNKISRDSYGHKYQNFMIPFWTTAITLGIMAITISKSIKFKTGVVIGYIALGLSAFVSLGTLFVFALHVPSNRMFRFHEMQNLSSAIEYFCRQNKGKLPNSQKWCDQFLNSIEDIETSKLSHLFCNTNSNNEKHNDIAINNNLDGYQVSDIEQKTVLFFTAEPGWNQCGTYERLSPTGHLGLWPFVEGGYYFVFVDHGSKFTVEFIKDSNIEDLNWIPSK